MIKFSLKYYLRCILVSIVGYVFGGAFLAWVASEAFTALSIIIPVVVFAVGSLTRVLILKLQCDKKSIYSFSRSDYLKMYIPVIFMFKDVRRV